MSFNLSCSKCGSNFQSEQVTGGNVCPKCREISSPLPKRSKSEIQADIKRIQEKSWENYKKNK